MRLTPSSSEVYKILKQEILDLVLLPGTPLSEIELSRRLGASRTPIRESLQQLSHERLVRLVPRKGAFVTEVTVPDIIELYQMRQALEPYAARLAARAEDRREALEPFLAELAEARTTISADDNSAYYQLTGRLDQTIAELAGNQRLAAALRQVWDQVYRARRLAGSNPDRLRETVGEHTRIVENVIAGNEVAAAEAVFQHLQASLENTLQSLWRLPRASAAPSATTTVSSASRR